MAEQGTHKPFVVGSTPTLATNDIEKIRIKSGFFLWTACAMMRRYFSFTLAIRVRI